MPCFHRLGVGLDLFLVRCLVSLLCLCGPCSFFGFLGLRSRLSLFGLLGRRFLGSFLGDKGVNIARMGLGRKPGSGRAIMLIEVDSEITAASSSW